MAEIRTTRSERAAFQFIRPAGDAALERQRIEPRLAHQEGGGARAPARAAIDDVLARLVEAARALADLLQRDQPRVLQPPQLPFLLVAAIDQRGLALLSGGGAASSGADLVQQLGS